MKHLCLALLAIFTLTGCDFINWGRWDKVGKSKLFNGEWVHEYRLKNELRVLVVPRHQAKVLTYQVWFRVGSVDEKLDPKLNKTGLAHLFEHMTFRGTEKYPDGMFDRLTSKMGATYQNASTYYHRTNYYESIPSSKLEDLMAIEADRMENLIINKDLFEKEKGAVVGELRKMFLDKPLSIGYDLLLKTVFKKSPYRWKVIGTEKDIRGFTLEEANYFYKTYYAPNNATIVVVGDVQPANLMRLVNKYYGHMEKQEIPHFPTPEEPAQNRERRARKSHKQASSEILLIGYRGPSVTTPDYIALSLLGSHLSNGMEAKLRKLLVDNGIAVSASAGPNSSPDLFEILVRLSEGKSARQALRILDRELANIRINEISKEDFARALAQERLDSYSTILNNSSLANAMGEYLMLCGNYLRGLEILEGYKKLEPKDLLKVAQTYLDPLKRTVVTISPSRRGSE